MSEPVNEGRREKRKRELRDRIYTVAQELFTAQGFEDTTVEQIAAAADVVPATFFNHFQNKNAVLAEMTTEVLPPRRRAPLRFRSRSSIQAEGEGSSFIAPSNSPAL